MKDIRLEPPSRCGDCEFIKFTNSVATCSMISKKTTMGHLTGEQMFVSIPRWCPLIEGPITILEEE